MQVRKKLNLINMKPKNPLSKFLKFLFSIFRTASLKRILNGEAKEFYVYPDLSSIRKWGIVCLALLSISLYSWGQSAGDYRTRATGNWNDNNIWEKYDGTSWNLSPDYPGASAGTGSVNILNNYFITLNVNPANSIGALTFEPSSANNITLSMSGQTLNVAGAVTFGAPSVDGMRQRIILGTGTLNCASVSMPITGAATRTTDITISSGILNVAGNITMNGASDRNNITFSSNGVLNVFGNFTGGGFTCSTSTVNYIGAAQIVGAYTYNNLTVSGGSTKSLSGSATVSGTLTLTSGVLRLGAFDLTLTNTTAVAGAPFSVTKMIETDGTGRFIRSATAINPLFSMTYPVGSNGYYSPLVISTLPAGASAARSITVRAVPVNLGILTNSLNKYWDIVTTGISTDGSTVLSFQYNAGEVVGNPLLFQPYNNVSGSWAIATGPSFPGSNPATSTGSSAITGLWTVGSPSTFYSYQTGFWDQASTWTFDPGGTTGPGTFVPGQNDKVVILTGRTVSLQANNSTQNLDITINNGGILDQSTFNFSNTLAALKGNGILKLSSSSFPAATINTFVSTDGGITEYNNTGNMSATQATYYHLVIRSSGAVIQIRDLTLNGSLNVKQGSYQINDATSRRLKLLIKGDVTVDNTGSITVGTGVTNSQVSPLGIVGSSVPPFLDYYEIESHRIQINGDFTNNGIVKFSNLANPVYNQFPSNGFATVYFQGLSDKALNCNGQTDFYNLILDKGNDQTFKLTVNSSAYSNFRLFGANTSAGDLTNPVTTAANSNLKKALWIKNGTFVLQGLVAIPSLSEGATAGPTSSDFFIPLNGALLIDGAGVIVMSTADDFTEVNAAYGLAGGSNGTYGINAVGGNSALSILGKLQVDNGYLSTRESSGLLYWSYASGQFIQNGGKVDAKQFHNPEGGAAGLISYVQNGGDFILRGRFTNTISYTNPADLANPAINTVRADNSIDIGAGIGTFSINSNVANAFAMSGGTLSIYDVTNITAAPLAFLVNSPVSNINVTGGMLQLFPTTGSGAADAHFYINSTAPFGNLFINRASGTRIVYLNTNPATVLGNLTILSGVFQANDLDVTIGGDFTIANGTTYNAGNNSTVMNGAGIQNFYLYADQQLYRFTIDKPAGIALNFAGIPGRSINVANNLRLILGTLNDNGNAINISGNAFNSGVHTGTGKVAFVGAAAQTIDGNGVFTNIELNNNSGAAGTAPVSLIANTTVDGVLTFSRDRLLNIGIYNLKLSAVSSIANGGALRYIQTAGNSGDGGVTKIFSSASTSFLFPVGAPTLIPVRPVKYTPATLGFTFDPATYGSVTVIPVGYEHPSTTVNGQSLTYFWRVASTGFSGIVPNSVTHTFVYSPADVVGTVGNYIPSLYNRTSFTWNNGTSSSINTGTSTITDWSSPTNSGNFLDADYTAGDAAFGTPKVYYSRINGAAAGSGLWNNVNTWSTDPVLKHTGAAAATVPGSNDIVIIGGRDSIYLSTEVPQFPINNNNPGPTYYQLDKAVVNSSSLQIEAGSVLDIQNNPGCNFGSVFSHPNGNGKIRLTTRHPSNFDQTYVFDFPDGDFSDFNVNNGTTEFYTINPQAGTVYILPVNVTSYGHVILAPLKGSNLILPNNSYTTINGDLICRGSDADAWLAMTWSDAAYGAIVAKTVYVKKNLIVQGGSFGFIDNGAIAQNIIIDGDVVVWPAAGIDVWNWASTSTNNSMSIGGSLINNSNNVVAPYGTPSIVRFDNGANMRCNVTFFGYNSASITNNSVLSPTPTTRFYRVTVNKGNSQATTLTLNVGGTLTTLSDNWLTLQNGTFRYMRTNPSSDFTISTNTPFTIPSTAGLYINLPGNTGNRNILIGNAADNNGDLFLSGRLTIIKGNVYVGRPGFTDNNNNDIEYTSSGASAIDIQGGRLVVKGQIRRDPSNASGVLKYSQTGGSVFIGGQASNSTNAKLEVLNGGSDFTMSNGKLTILRGFGINITPSSPFGDLYIRPETFSITGGTIIFSQIGATAQNYFLDANVPLFNLTVRDSAGLQAQVRLLTSPLVLNGNMNINTNGVLNTNNVNVTFNGNLINIPGTGGYIAGTNLTTFSATNTQSITGATDFFDMVVNPGTSLTLGSPSTVNHNLTLSTGNFIIGNNVVSLKGNFANNASYTDINAPGNGLILNGTTLQHITGSGSFARLTLNNAAGAQIENDLTLTEDLTLIQGIFDIKKSLVTLDVNSNVVASPAGTFGASKMITSDGVFSNVGLRKFFNPGALTFLYPIGTSGKYTPALLTITANSTVGYVRINNINSRHPALISSANALDYYWEVQSSGISGFSGSLVLNYLQEDVVGDEPNYLTARLMVPGTNWSLFSGVDPVFNTITTGYTTVNNLSGEYTAGNTSSFFGNVPVYTSNKDGKWKDKTIWDNTGGDSYPCPKGGPNGFIVVIKDVVTIDSNFCSAYRTTINNRLEVKSPYYGHNLGTVDGNGTLYLESGSFPAGVFTSFLSCANNGTVEYGGVGTYSIIADLYDNIPNVVFSGTGTRVLPDKDLTICNLLEINGPILDNSVYNKKLTIQGTMSRISGSFNSGSGAGATVSFAGGGPQTIGGAILGDFTGLSAFNNYEINNSAGLRVNDAGAIEVSGKLLLTNGLINTSSSRKLTITNPSNNCVVPVGGSANSFVDGPLIKDISQYDNFLFPIGKSGTPNILGNKLRISSTQTGPLLWSAEYITPNTTSANVASPLRGVSAQEYYTIIATTGSKAIVNINWTPTSDVTPVVTGGMSNIRLAKYNTGTSSWAEIPTFASGDNSNGTATSSILLTSTGTDDYTLGSITDLKPRAKLSPAGPVCGSAGIPVIFTAPYGIPFDYILNYTIDGFAQIPVTITPAMLPYTLPTTPGPGVYKLTDFTYNVGSGSIVGVVDASSIAVYALPTTANAGPDQPMCGVTTSFLAGNNPTSGTGLWSIIGGAGGTLISPTSNTSQFIGLNGVSYTLRWTISNGTCISADDVIINFTIPTEPGASPAQSLCGNPTVANLVATPPGGYTVDWYATLSGGSPLGGGTALISGNTYYAESSGGSGCKSLTRTPVLVTIYPVPVPGLIGPNSVCLGSTGNVYSTEPGKSNYAWSVVGGFISSGGLGTDNTATVTWNTTGPQTVSVNYKDVGGCTAAVPTLYAVTVKPDNTLNRTSAIGTDAQTICINTAITNITYATTGATGATVTGLPAGVTSSWAGDVVTIGGIPTVSGPFTYTVTLTGGCGVVTTAGTITVAIDNTLNRTSAVGTDAQTLCIHTAITNITYATTGATGASVTGLPAGLTGSWAGNVVTINGTPTVSGPFTYTVTLTGGCGVVVSTGTITVITDNILNLTSAAGTDAQTSCINTAITNITYATIGATGATVTGLPAGITGSWAGNVVTISGTPTVSGPFTYTVTLTGGCGVVATTGTIAVTALPTAAISYTGSPWCSTAPVQNVTLTGTSGGLYSAAPAGLALDALTGAITPGSSTGGTYTVTYTIAAAGGCGIVTATATVTVTTSPIATINYAGAPFCTTVSTPQLVSLVGTGGGTFSAVPGGLSISPGTGDVTPSTSAAGTYTVTYVIPATGGCGIFTTTTNVTITDLPTATISYIGTPFCISVVMDQPVTLTGTGAYIGGTYSSTAGLTINPATGDINPGTSTAGTYTVTYSTPVSGGCAAVPVTTAVTITALPVATFNYTATPYCSSSANPLPTFVAGGVAGVFSSTAGLAFVSTVTGQVNLATSTPGTYSVTNTIAAADGCAMVTSSGPITITAVPTATINYAGTPFCKSLGTDQPVTLTGTGAYTGGAYSSTPGLSINASTGDITPGASTEGTYTVTYTIPASSGCASVSVTTSVTITVLPTATIIYAGSPYCITIGAGQAVTLTGTSGGSYSSMPAGLSLNPVTGAINPSLSAAGTYTVTYTIAPTGGCGTATATAPVTITAFSPATFSYAGSPYCIDAVDPLPTYNGGGVGGVFTSTAGLIFVSTATGQVDLSASALGTYTVTNTVAAAGGCGIVSATSTITIITSPTAAISYTGSPWCNSSPVQNVTFAGTSGGTYSALPAGLSINAVTGDIIPGTSTAGTYTVTYTSPTSGGCVAVTATTNITIDPAPVVTITNPAAVCALSTVNLTAAAVTAGSTAGLTYTYWTDAAATTAYPTPATATAGTYYIKGTDPVTSCYDIKPVIVTVTSAPTVTTTQVNVACFNGTTGTATAIAAGGTGAYTYLWNTIPAQTTVTATGLSAGTYTVNVIDGNGCSAATSTTITEPATALSGSIASQTNVSVSGGNDGSVTVAGSGGISPYQYKLGSGTYQVSGTFGTLTAGSYTVTVQDINLCTFIVAFTITQPIPPLSGSITSQTNVTCFGTSTGSVTVAGSGGVTPYEYKLDVGSYQSSGTFGALASGNFTVTIRDAALNTFDVSFSVTQPPSAVSGAINSQANVLCFGSNTGSVTISGSGGTTPYQYKLGSGSYQVSGTFGSLTAGTYTATVRDANLCTFDMPVTITQPVSALSGIITSQTNVLCFGSTNGSVTVTGSGGASLYTYGINGGAFQASGTFASLAAGTYTITVRDANLCTINVTASITEPAALSIAYTKEDATCPGVKDGKITLTVTGGTQPYYAIWSGGETTLDLTNISDGIYSVVVTDKNGCAASLDISVGVIGTGACIEVQEIITPNNDGFNDTWKIKNIDLFPNAEVFVFNRWGKLVFNTKNISANPWDGRFKGKLLPTDSYHYVLHLNDGSEPRSGVVSIIR